MCTQDCPRRQGFRRRDVAAMLAIGRVPRGLHPDSCLISDAIANHRRSEATERARYQTLCTQITELQAVLQEQEQRAETLRQWQVRLRRYIQTDEVTHGEQYREPGQPEDEP